MGVYDNVKKAAEEQGISIYRLERETGLSNGTIGKWNDAIPSSQNLMKVAKRLNIKVEELINNEEERK